VRTHPWRPDLSAWDRTALHPQQRPALHRGRAVELPGHGGLHVQGGGGVRGPPALQLPWRDTPYYPAPGASRRPGTPGPVVRRAAREGAHGVPTAHPPTGAVFASGRADSSSRVGQRWDPGRSGPGPNALPWGTWLRRCPPSGRTRAPEGPRSAIAGRVPAGGRAGIDLALATWRVAIGETTSATGGALPGPARLAASGRNC
jgi:hypothetical protein